MGSHQLDFLSTSSPPPLLMTFVYLATASHFHRHDYEYALHLGALYGLSLLETGSHRLSGFRVVLLIQHSLGVVSRTLYLDHLRLNGGFRPLRT